MKKIILIIFFNCFFVFSAEAFMKENGIFLETAKPSQSGEMSIRGLFTIQSKIKPIKDQNLKFDILSIPFEWRMGLKKGREIGVEIQIDNQKTSFEPFENSGASLSKIGLHSKFRIMKNLGMKLKLGFSQSGESYYSTDGVYGKAEILIIVLFME